MYRLFLVLLINMFLAFYLNAQQARTGVEKYLKIPDNYKNVKIKGNIKTLKIYEVKAKENNSNTNKASAYMHCVLTYDKNGNMLEEKHFKGGDTLNYYVRYSYNKNNNHATDSTYDRKNKLTERSSYKYENGYLIEEQKFNASGSLDETKKYLYNIKNWVSEMKGLDAAGKGKEKYIYFYDSVGHNIEKSYYGDKWMKVYKMQSVYNKKGSVVNEIYFNQEDVLWRMVEYFDFIMDHELVTCYYIENEMIDRVYTHQYMFDKNGNPNRHNILTSDSFGKKPIPELVQIIEIEYF